MNIEGTNEIKAVPVEGTNKVVKDNTSSLTKDTSKLSSSLNEQTKQAIDKATGLLQTIVTDKFSEEVIRKMPPDEYLKLLSLIDEMISGSIDNNV